MPQTRACDYCGADIEPGTGTMFVANDGTVTHYCSAKCEKNADLNREPRDLEWTEAGAGAPAAETADAESEPAEETDPDAAEPETPDLEAAEEADTAEEAESDDTEEAESDDAESDEEDEAEADDEEVEA